MFSNSQGLVPPYYIVIDNLSMAVHEIYVYVLLTFTFHAIQVQNYRQAQHGLGQ